MKKVLAFFDSVLLLALPVTSFAHQAMPFPLNTAHSAGRSPAPLVLWAMLAYMLFRYYPVTQIDLKEN